MTMCDLNVSHVRMMIDPCFSRAHRMQFLNSPTAIHTENNRKDNRNTKSKSHNCNTSKSNDKQLKHADILISVSNCFASGHCGTLR